MPHRFLDAALVGDGMSEPFSELYDAGIAVGRSDIRTDTIQFSYRKEQFDFPTIAVIPHIAKHNGYFYEADIDELRKLEAAFGMEKNGRS